MEKLTVLIVDPGRTQRESFQTHLSLRFNVVIAGDIATATRLFGEQQPQAVVANLRQNSAHGLEFCKTLREQPTGERTFLMVYGNPGSTKTVDREAMQRKWRVDVFLPQDVTVQDIEPLLWHELTRREVRKPPENGPKLSNTTDPRASNGNRNAKSGPEPTGLRRLFSSEISLETIKSVFTRGA